VTLKFVHVLVLTIEECIACFLWDLVAWYLRVISLLLTLSSAKQKTIGLE